LAEEQRKAREEAEENSRFKDRLLPLFHIEMRTPLTSHLRCFTAALWCLARTIHQHRLGDGATRSRLLGASVNDLLDSERIRTSKMQLEMKPVNLVPVSLMPLKRCVTEPRRSRSALPRRRSLPTMWCRVTLRDWSKSVEPVDNAVKFTPRGWPHRCVCELTCHRTSKEVELTVSDTGKGIAPEFLPHVFDQFRQEEESHSRSYWRARLRAVHCA
jgi:signal transduction histidine kinase